MAHAEQFFFVGSVAANLKDYFSGKKVLEVGSLDLNGSVRQYFSGCDYTGLDVGPGKGVDLVCPGQDFGGPAQSYDVVISCEMMEHNPDWAVTWLNMLRLLKGDGLLLMTCATTGRRKHGTPDRDPSNSPLTVGKGQNYYRNLTGDDFARLTPLDAWFSESAFFADAVSKDLYFIGLGPRAPAPTRSLFRALVAAFEAHYREKNINGAY